MVSQTKINEKKEEEEEEEAGGGGAGGGGGGGGGGGAGAGAGDGGRRFQWVNWPPPLMIPWKLFKHTTLCCNT